MVFEDARAAEYALSHNPRVNGIQESAARAQAGFTRVTYVSTPATPFDDADGRYSRRWTPYLQPRYTVRNKS
jgi:hypothetical protein